MSESYRSHSGYFQRAFGNIDQIADDMRIAVEGVEFDTVVGTGLSGTLVVPTIGRAFGVNWAIVRKEHSPHTDTLIEGEIGRKWMFVDDFISTGATLARVRKVLDDLKIHQVVGKDTWGYERWDYVPFLTEYVGTYEYERNNYDIR